MKCTAHQLFKFIIVAVLLQLEIVECIDTFANVSDNTLVAYSDALAIKKCVLELKLPTVREEVTGFIDGNVRLIKYHFDITGDKGPFAPNRTESTMLIRPYKMMLAVSGTGKSLLALKEYFQPMSVYTLGYGIAEVEAELIQRPLNCLENLNATYLERELKLLVLRNFGNTTSSSMSGKEVCNQHVHVTESTKGSVKYVCCELDAGSKLVCRDLKKTSWIHFLFIIIVILQVIFVLYSPNMIPAGGRMGTKFLDYILKPEQALTLNVVTVDANKVISDDTFVKAKQFPFLDLANLKHEIRNLTPGILHSLLVHRIHLSVRASKIIPDGYSPVSFVKFLKNFFVRCKLRKELPGLGVCCKANMMKKCKCFVVPWYKCLTLLMWIVVAILVTSPWLLRVWFFYAFEEDIIERITRVITNNGLTPSYPGSLILQLTPGHVLFKIIYFFIPVEIIIYMLLPSVAKRKLKFTVQMSMKNMRNTRKFDSVISFFTHMLWPLEEFGLLGIFIFPLWLLVMPLGLMVLVYQVFPIVNLTVRLLINFVYYTVKFINPEYLYQCCESETGITARICDLVRQSMEDVIVVDRFERKCRRNMMTHVISLTLCITTIFMLLVLLVECVAFYVECAIYAVIGIILNSRNVMKFLSLAVLIIWYAFDCFSSVSSCYADFAKVINSEVQTKVGDIVKTVAMCAKKDQKEEAFTLPPKDNGVEERMTMVAGTEGYLKWKAKRLVLFLDTEDIPYIPKDLVFKAAKLGHFSCPGPVHIMYLKALVELLSITLFLGFVMVVILAFGEANNISGANQTLATLASGFLPFVFRKFLIKSHSGPSLDKSNITWQTTFSEALDTYNKRWSVKDCDIGLVLKTDDLNNDDLQSQPRIINLGSTIPDNVDMIVKLHGGINTADEKMEFWVRKAESKESVSPYLWRRNQRRMRNNEMMEMEIIEV